MFKSVRLGSVLGIPITVHWSLLVLVGWFIASKYQSHGTQAAVVVLLQWAGVFASVLAHEYGHILTARLYGIGTKSINLSPLGGIASLDSYPERPGAQALVALGGPAVSLVLAAVFGAWSAFAYGMAGLFTPAGFLFVANSTLLIFNLLPIYPMDGGRVVNAILLKIGGKRFASAVSLYLGQAGGLCMAAGGIYLQSPSLALIGAFMFAVVSLEFDSPVLAWVGIKTGNRHKQPAGTRGEAFESYRQRAPVDGEISGASEGIFVAFDGNGRHFAYARHWLDGFSSPEDQIGQMETIAEYGEEARALGGQLRLLSLDEYRKQVLAA